MKKHILAGLVPNSDYEIRVIPEIGEPSQEVTQSSAAGILHFETDFESGQVVIAPIESGIPSDHYPKDEEEPMPLEKGWLHIYNVKGQILYSAQLTREEFKNFVWHRKTSQGTNVASGIYFLRYQNIKRKVMVIR